MGGLCKYGHTTVLSWRQGYHARISVYVRTRVRTCVWHEFCIDEKFNTSPLIFIILPSAVHSVCVCVVGEAVSVGGEGGGCVCRGGGGGGVGVK